MSAGSAAEDKRLQRLSLLEDEIGRKLAESAASGELAAAPSYGRPLDFGDGYDETPDALKMPMKILKDAGYAPPEVMLMQEIAALAKLLEGAPDTPDTRARQRKLAEMRQQLALQLEKLRGGALF